MTKELYYVTLYDPYHDTCCWASKPMQEADARCIADLLRRNAAPNQITRPEVRRHAKNP